MNCDMCGKDTQLFVTLIEGAKMQLCKECSSYGKVFGNVKTKEEKVEEDKRIKAIIDRGTKKVIKILKLMKLLQQILDKLSEKKEKRFKSHKKNLQRC